MATRPPREDFSRILDDGPFLETESDERETISTNGSMQNPPPLSLSPSVGPAAVEQEHEEVASTPRGGVSSSLPSPRFIYERMIFLPPYLTSEGHVKRMFNNLTDRYAVAYLRPFVLRKTAHGGSDQSVKRVVYVDGQREVLVLLDHSSGVVKREVPIAAIYGVMVEGEVGKRGAAETPNLAIVMTPRERTQAAPPSPGPSPHVESPRSPRAQLGTAKDPRRPPTLPPVEEASPERVAGNDNNILLFFGAFPPPMSARSKAVAANAASAMGGPRDHVEALVAVLRHFNPNLQISQGKAPGELKALAPNMRLLKPKDYVPPKAVVPDMLRKPPTKADTQEPQCLDVAGLSDKEDYEDEGGDSEENSDLEALARNIGYGDDDRDVTPDPFDPGATLPRHDVEGRQGRRTSNAFDSVPYAVSEEGSYVGDDRRRSSVLLALNIELQDPLQNEPDWSPEERTQLQTTFATLRAQRSGLFADVLNAHQGGQSLPPAHQLSREEVQHAHTYFSPDSNADRCTFLLQYFPSRVNPASIDADTDADDGDDEDKEAKYKAATMPDEGTATDPSVVSSNLQQRIHALLSTPSAQQTPLGRLFRSTLTSAITAPSTTTSQPQHAYYPYRPRSFMDAWAGSASSAVSGGNSVVDLVKQALHTSREGSAISASSSLVGADCRPRVLNSVFFGEASPFPELCSLVDDVRGLVYCSSLASPTDSIDRELRSAQRRLLEASCEMLLRETKKSDEPQTSNGGVEDGGADEDRSEDGVDLPPHVDLFPPLLDLPTLLKKVDQGATQDRRGFLQWRDRLTHRAAAEAHKGTAVSHEDMEPPIGEVNLVSLPGGFLEWAQNQHLQNQPLGVSPGVSRAPSMARTTTSMVNPTMSSMSTGGTHSPSTRTLMYSLVDDEIRRSLLSESAYAALWGEDVVDRIHAGISPLLPKEVSFQVDKESVRKMVAGLLLPWMQFSWPRHVDALNRGAAAQSEGGAVKHSQALLELFGDAWEARFERHIESAYTPQYRQLALKNDAAWGDVFRSAGGLFSTLPRAFSITVFRHMISRLESSKIEIERGNHAIADLKKRIRNVDALVSEAHEAVHADHLGGGGTSATRASVVPSVHHISAAGEMESRRVPHPDYTREVNLATLIFNICELERQRRELL